VPAEQGTSGAYTDFAAVYDDLAAERRYEQWASFVATEVARHRPPPGAVYELACGTGRLLAQLRTRGFAVVGMDRSEQMLARARHRLGADVALFAAALPTVPPPPVPVAVVLCVFDSFNYLEDDEAAVATLRAVRAALPPTGLFVCDTVNRHVFERCVAQGTAEHAHGHFRTRTSTTRTGSRSYVHQVTVTLTDADPPVTFTEAHRQRFFDPGWLRAAAADDYTSAPAGPRTERVTWVLSAR
jgi:SAM-dependent methyltransferase